jgi:hypothetical protein
MPDMDCARNYVLWTGLLVTAQMYTYISCMIQQSVMMRHGDALAASSSSSSHEGIGALTIATYSRPAAAHGRGPAAHDRQCCSACSITLVFFCPNLHTPDLGAVQVRYVCLVTACRNQDVIRRVVLIDEAGSCGLCEATPKGIRLAGHWEAATAQYSDPLQQEQVQILQRWEEEEKENKKSYMIG